MDRFVYAIEGLNVWVGRAFGWCILILTLSVSYEVFVRYVLNAPTVWSMDMMIQMYGALFLMAGPYALAQDAHVRGDFLYRLLSPKTQGKIDLILYVLFFFPGMLALFWYGAEIAADRFCFSRSSIVRLPPTAAAHRNCSPPPHLSLPCKAAPHRSASAAGGAAARGRAA